MYRVHHYKYAPILIGGTKTYRIELPLDVTPRAYRTMTTPMQSWNGEVVKAADGRAQALIRPGAPAITGDIIGYVVDGGPCVVMEHITVDGELDFMIGDKNILNGNNNFINFGVPGGRHIRIDIYTGESRIIDGC